MHINDLLKDYILIVPKYASYNFSLLFYFDQVKYDPDIFMKVLCDSFTNNFLLIIFISLSLSGVCIVRGFHLLYVQYVYVCTYLVCVYIFDIYSTVIKRFSVFQYFNSSLQLWYINDLKIKF